ncbi:MAG TPA: ABC transporter permease [Terriglobales bacterium]|jgi:predicted permease|nr:ABC transporter permease [Terriglobales bacterium]
METLLQDIRYGLRALKKSPGLTLVVAITIALGVGANTATFSLVNGFFLRPLPVPSPEQLVALAIQEKNSPLGALGFSYPEFAAFRQQAAPSCEVFGQALAGSPGLTADGRTDPVSMTAVTSNYFSGLGVKPGLGRLILPSEGETMGEQAVLVLGYSFWQKRFGGDPGVIGKQVRINGKPVEIIGVVPKEFHGSFSTFEMDAYVPLSAVFPGGSGINFWTDRNKRLILAVGRLKPGVNIAKAQGLFDVISQREAGEYPASDKGFSIRVIPEKLSRPIPYANTAFLLISALFLILSGVVLLLACTNVANILMARASSRMREMAIRTALGGGRGRLVRQMLTETMLLASLGGVLGVLFGMWAGRLSGSIHFPNVPLQLDTGFDWLVFVYAFAVVLLTGIFVGLAPALIATRAEINVVLHQGDTREAGRSGHRARGDLMVAQVAGSLALLIVAGLFVRSLQNAEKMDLGFNPAHVLNVALDPQENGYNEAQTKDFYRELESKVKALPGVESASLASSVPISTFPSRQRIYVENQPVLPDSVLPDILFNRIDSGYFKTMSIPILIGREFLDSDNESAPSVAIVNQTMADRLWPGRNPIGQRFSMKSESGPFIEVAGVACDSKYQTIAEDPQAYFYAPIAQNYTSLRILQIRSSIALPSLTNQIQAQIRSLDPAVTIVDIRTMNESLQGATGFFIFRLGASLAALVGVMGLILAIVGVYGMVSYSVTRRTQEIGIRVALGANSQQILGLIVKQGMKTVLGGVLLGLLAAWAVTRMMTHLLVGVSPNDPAIYIAASIFLTSVALFGCYIPAHRAAKVDPMVALRYE